MGHAANLWAVLSEPCRGYRPNSWTGSFTVTWERKAGFPLLLKAPRRKPRHFFGLTIPCQVTTRRMGLVVAHLLGGVALLCSGIMEELDNVLPVAGALADAKDVQPSQC
jgi:hypothetical protein